MLNRFSKPSGDVALEGERLLREEAENLRRERVVSALLAGGSRRKDCLACGESLEGLPSIPHRSVPYLLCARCGHFQSERAPSQEHGLRLQAEIPFHAIYRPLPREAYQSRIDRVYRPKLDWILDSAGELGCRREDLLARSWLEIGCGAGFFLKALLDAGAGRVAGLDQDARLVDMANQVLDNTPARHFTGTLPDALRAQEADIYAAFFVLEHTDRLVDFLAALKEKPKGTLFCFSVPVLGLGAALESGFDHFYARNLDSAVHTQLFTDRSIAHALASAGFAVASQWVFGQDASDFVRLLVTKLQSHYPPSLLDPMKNSLAKIQDAWQAALDLNFLSDSRHILAVRI